ncbi:PPR domain-containing protein/PPR_2 domain-containing protein/PPR_3 domain-containing protein, partial [Cephalotus follicularis]
VKELISQGLYEQTLELYKQEIHPCSSLLRAHSTLLPSLIKACSSSNSPHLGLQLHSMAVKTGSDSDTVVSNSLISLYAKFSFIQLASELFDTMPHRDTVSWNSIINCYLHNGCSLKALQLFKQMYTFGFVKNEVSWTAMISGCNANHNYEMAINCFRAMQRKGVEPNRVTLLAVLPAFAKLVQIKHGKEIHGYAIRREFDSDHHLSSALINVYCKCKEALHTAKHIFERSKVKDVVIWSSIIGSYSQRGDIIEAIKLFRRMRVEGVKPNSVTFLVLISACTLLTSLSHGCGVHGYILKLGINFDIFIGNALINMYTKCGCLMASQQLFNEMPVKDSVSWSSLISACGLHGRGEEAVRLFHKMRERGTEPDAITFLAVLSACNHAGLVEEGKRIFNHAMKANKVSLTVEHYASVIDLLGRSGRVEDACSVVSRMPMKPSAKIFSSLVSSCKIHGRLEVAESLANILIGSEPQNPANHTLLSMVFAEANNWVNVEEVRRAMK